MEKDCAVMLRTMPEVGKIYTPDNSIVPISDGLPRTVTYVATRPNTDRYVVHYTSEDGAWHQSDNLWQQWMDDTRAKPE